MLKQIKSRRIFKEWMIFLFLLLPVISHGSTINVPDDYTTIQSAIDASVSGDTIVVATGTYYENINFNGKNIVLQSTDPTDPEIVAGTIIDGSQSGSVVTFSGDETEECILSGFTITNGNGTYVTSQYNDIYAYGGGIYGNGTLATIKNNHIEKNTLKDVRLVQGGGIYECNGLIENNLITENSVTTSYYAAAQGGGLFDCDGTIRGNVISNNISITGGGICDCDGIIEGNIICGNTSTGASNLDGGGGIARCGNVGGFIINNLIYDNTARYHGGGLYNCANIINNSIYGNYAYAGELYNCSDIKNCIIWNNRNASNLKQNYCAIKNGNKSDDWNIRVNPEFVDAENGDFHLKEDSPCIDAGGYTEHVTVDFEGNIRGLNGVMEERGDGSDYDVGAYEYTIMAPEQQPYPPTNILPSEGETSVSVFPELASSPFQHPDASSEHRASQWQIKDSPDSDTIIYDSGTDEVNKTSIKISFALEFLTKYYWRVRYLDSSSVWSEWSSPSSFITESNTEINIPLDYSTIQEAIDIAIQGDEIIVSTGTYYENINFKGKNIILRSTDPTDPEVVAGTVIDGSQSGPVVTFSGNESSECTLSGFTITNGNGYFRESVLKSNTRYGGGIYGNYTLATIRNNIVRNNILKDVSSAFGGGMHRCYGLIENNIITENTAEASFSLGGGLYDCVGVIRGNVISNNRSGSSGGGLGSCGRIIENNIIFGNTGGGLYDSGWYGYIKNNIIYGNTGENGGGLRNCQNVINNTIYGNSATHGGGIYGGHNVQNCIIWSNESTDNVQIGNLDLDEVNFCCIGDWEETVSWNINLDPRFVDPENGNFHLMGDSPCIDAGGYAESVTLDIEGNSRGYNSSPEERGDGSNYDMGAYEFIGAATSQDKPYQPVNILPINGSLIDVPIPELVSSNYSHPNINSNHTATQWQIDDSYNFSSPVYDSHLDYVNKTSMAVPDNGCLYTSTEYYWKVRYMDDHYVWSNWSSPTSFITREPMVIYVPDDYSSIQAAIDNSIGGDTIIVSPGYYGSVGFKGKNIILRSTDPEDWDIVKNTKIYAASFSGTESSLCTLSGFFMEYQFLSGGGGISGGNAYTHTHANIIRNILGGPMLDDENSGMGIYYCDGIISRNIIHHKSTALYECNGIISNNVVINNFFGIEYCDGIIQNNTIYHNLACGIYGSDGVIRNSIIWGNSSLSYIFDVDIDGQQIYRSSSPTYSCIENWSGGGTGNINLSPEFIGSNIGDIGVFRLSSDSPCIDSGITISDLKEDIDGNIRPYGDGYDMGAYEFYDATGEIILEAYPTSGCLPLNVELLGEAKDNQINNYSWLMDKESNPETHYASNASYIYSTTSYTFNEAGSFEVYFFVENNLNETRFAAQVISVYTPESFMDLNENGEIEMGDILEFIDCWNTQDLKGDFKEDYKVDYLDLFYLADKWGIKFDSK